MPQSIREFLYEETKQTVSYDNRESAINDDDVVLFNQTDQSADKPKIKHASQIVIQSHTFKTMRPATTSSAASMIRHELSDPNNTSNTRPIEF
jgi:hypothetical protein